NDGGTWNLINSGLPNRYVSAVKASPNSTQQAIATFSGYRNNDTLPHIYYTQNQGSSWTSIAGDLPNFAINDVWIQLGKQDSNIVVATDGGVYATRNKGAHWERVGNNMPIIPVFDIDYNPATKRLIAGTFARSMQTMEVDSIFNSKEQTNVGVSSTISSNAVILYPNPSQTHFTISAEDLIKVTLIDLYGRVVRDYSANYISSRYFPCSDIKNGHYLVMIKTNKGTTYQSLQILQ
ncbi:MAG TPA: T9SS type A sorting domain-containing protein, partial [Chitinophagaceae bacterium]|nr:T9SS type A sorting domain-containing protein [Chitinophagaceae bacterium]